MASFVTFWVVVTPVYHEEALSIKKAVPHGTAIPIGARRPASCCTDLKRTKESMNGKQRKTRGGAGLISAGNATGSAGG